MAMMAEYFYYKMLFVGLLTAAQGLGATARNALACALEVGRNENPSDWACTGCDASNKPEFVYHIE